MRHKIMICCAATFLGALTLTSGCKKEYSPTKEITEVRDATAQEKRTPTMNTADRLRMTQAPAMAPGGMPPFAGGAAEAAPSESAAPQFRWVVPEGWEELPATQLRTINLRLKSNPEVEMYFTVMPGDGGGMLSNVNRWYKQMGQPALTQEQVDALPSKIMLFRPAAFVNLRGDFVSMGAEAKKDYALFGLVLIDSGHAMFLKMTGPYDAAAAELTNFVGFSQSITPADLNTKDMQLKAVPAEGADAAAAAPAAPATTAASTPSAPAAMPAAAAGGGPIPAADALKWEAPQGWEKSGERPMRVVTFTSGNTECYISVLGGVAGGMEANINRWCGQMGHANFTPEAIAALEKITVLGAPSPLVDIEGDFKGMGDTPQTGYRLLGVVRSSDTQSLFVKMTGPKEEVAAQADNFKAFVASLH